MCRPAWLRRPSLVEWRLVPAITPNKESLSLLASFLSRNKPLRRTATTRPAMPLGIRIFCYPALQVLGFMFGSLANSLALFAERHGQRPIGSRELVAGHQRR